MAWENALQERAAQEAGEAGLLLERQEGMLVLTDGTLKLAADLKSMVPRIKSKRFGQELLLKAVRIKGMSSQLQVVDATAGLGEDSLVMAAAGFDVVLFERDCVIAALLEDALRRAAHDDVLGPATARMHLRCEDSIEGLQSLDHAPDVVFLDPMFPAKQKQAKTNKKLQLFQKLESPCSDEESLMEAALAAHPRKMVVKRPLKGPALAGRRPSHAIEGKTIRYDCIVLPK